MTTRTEAPFRAPVLPRPYRDEEADVDWSMHPFRSVAVAELIPTQECIRLDRLAELAAGHAPECNDVPHVVCMLDRYLIHDGHTRWVLALVRQQPTMRVRLLHLGSDVLPTATCSLDGCGFTFSHFHRDTLDGEEVVRTFAAGGVLPASGALGRLGSSGYFKVMPRSGQPKENRG